MAKKKSKEASAAPPPRASTPHVYKKTGFIPSGARIMRMHTGMNTVHKALYPEFDLLQAAILRAALREAMLMARTRKSTHVRYLDCIYGMEKASGGTLCGYRLGIFDPKVTAHARRKRPAAAAATAEAEAE